MIIGFAGYPKSGKDTAAAHLIKEYDFERRAFADPLKRSVAALLDIPFSEVDKLKLDQTIHVAVGRVADVDDSIYPLFKTSSFRVFLARYGTESHRGIFGDDFWLDQTLPVDGFYQGRKIVVTDVRFQNEIDRINELGGIVCRLKRPGTEPKYDHISERYELLNGISYEIMNDTSVEDFFEEVDRMLDFVLSPQP